MQPFSRPPPHLLPFGQCIVEQTTLPLLNSLIVYCRVSSNFHFSLSIILFLVQKYWFIKKISRGGWSGFGKALVWIDPNCHENCLDWSKLFSSLSKLHPNRRCSVILPWGGTYRCFCQIFRQIPADSPQYLCFLAPYLTIFCICICICKTNPSRSTQYSGCLALYPITFLYLYLYL